MWRLAGIVSKSESKPINLGLRLESPVVAISCSCSAEDSDNWVRAGWVRPVASSLGLGKVYGPSQLLLLRGIQQLHFQVPSYPFDLEFYPRPWVHPWTMKVWSRELEDVQEPTPTLDLIWRKLQDMEGKIDAL
jgi:hypothetical protein